MIKKIKGRFRRPRETVKSQIERHTRKDPHVEHAFVKAPREKLENVSLDQKRASVSHDFEKIKKYMLNISNKKKQAQLIHTHVNQANIPHIPSIKDLFKMPMTNMKEINAFSITDSKGKEIGRVIYNYSEKNKSFIKKVREVQRYGDIAAEQIVSKKIKREDFSRNYDILSRELTEIQMMEFSKKIKIKIENWTGREYLEFFKDIGFNIKIRPSKGYTYDFETLRFIKK